ncbi:MAG: hypothetical protein OXH86_02150 [Acidimicrobiaceae bacterium]|nr:hypothetical protein [Acidimicrobiaceae bacterium]
MGADVLFAGGVILDAPLRSNTARLELREQVWRFVQQEFTADRLVPDFYSRVLGEDAHRLVKVFQTVDAWLLTADFGPTVLYVERGTGGIVDKCCLRDLAVEFGVDRELVWEAKEPLQQSTGIIAALEHYGRERMASEVAARTYTDPLDEAPEIVIARMGLREALRLEADADGAGTRDVFEDD